MNKQIDKEQLFSCFKDGMTVMIGGFMGNGAPEGLIDLLLESKVREITLISTDTAFEQIGSGRLISAKRVSRLIASHIGLNPETGRQMNSEELHVELVPQGTLAERIRCAGAGLGGFLTPTGLGTLVAESKQTLRVEGKEYLLETPLFADLALIKGSQVDPCGNVFYRGTTQNFNPLMATAANKVIVEAGELVETGGSRLKRFTLRGSMSTTSIRERSYDCSR
ncbi:3-oxoacid CoA-transferase subunit A [Dongshaea marina]|uniref:3-oxoacid CoA-transferase subunit A n=1 Tax=Dongshaea marina TaxID=2047966 RepID=UPI0019012DFE|nr:3-oxoacid CoA-transferase subunit A [Dongshaea marina]